MSKNKLSIYLINVHQWTAYKCLIAEFDYADNSYCLNNGKWYKIDKNFAINVNNEYEQIDLCELDCCTYSSADKDQYNEDLFNEELSEYLTTAALIHKVGEIPFWGGTGNRIEVCDILTADHQLIHIKKNASSSYLSHLFTQATVSAEALIDINFRAKWEAKLREHDYGTLINILEKKD